MVSRRVPPGPRPTARSGHLEAVDVGQLDVEQDDARPKRLDRRDGRRAVLRLPHHAEPFGLEQRAGQRPEMRVIIDDQHGRPHVS
jgi:hypothetical protein